MPSNQKGGSEQKKKRGFSSFSYRDKGSNFSNFVPLRALLSPIHSLTVIALILAVSRINIASGQQTQVSAQLIDRLNRAADRSIVVNLDSTFIYASRAYKDAKQLNYIPGILESLDLLGQYYYGKNDINASIEQYYLKLDIYHQYPSHPGHAATFARIAILFSMAGAKEKAYYYLDKAWEVLQDQYYPKDAAQYYDAVASINLKFKDFIAAKEALYMAIGYHVTLHDTVSNIHCYRTLGDLYLQQDQLDNAIFFYNIALQMIRHTANLTEEGVLLTRIGHVYQQKKDTVQLLRNNLHALRVREQTGRKDFIGGSLINVGAIYMESGKKDSALIYLSRGVKMVKETGNLNFLEHAYQQLYYYFKREKEHKQAFQYFRLYIETRKKLSEMRLRAMASESVMKRILLESETRRQLLQQKIEIQELQIRNRKIRILFYEVLFVVISGLVILIYLQARKVIRSRKSILILNIQMEEEIRQRIEAEKKLVESEALYRFIAENTTDVISLLDAQLNRIYISPSCKSVYGYTEEEIYAMEGIIDLIHGSHRERVLRAFKIMMKDRKPAKFTYRALRKNGTTFWAESLVNPIFNPSSGALREMVIVVRDITRRIEYEEMIARNASQREFLLREIHSRVKNNFAILISLMDLQKNLKTEENLKGEISDLQLRVRAMSLVHEQLYRSDSIDIIRFDEYLSNLAIIISSAFSNNRIRLHTLIEPCNFHIRLALPLGLIVNELLTNAFKYAFPRSGSGNVWITLDSRDGQYNLSIADDGVGLPPGFNFKNPTSMGSRIISILIEQIEANLEIGRGKGATFHIRFSDKND